MKKINKIGISLLLLLAMAGIKHGTAFTNAREAAAKNPAFRIVGYLPTPAIGDAFSNGLDLGKINYLNIAFINPDPSGNFTVPAGLAAVVNAAHEKKVKVLISIGGGSAPAYYPSLLRDTLRGKVIKNLVELVTANDLDGVDVDLEGPLIDSNYEAFVTGLSAALKAEKKLLTSAVATAYAPQYTDKALAVYDFINVMSYDKTGPWRPGDPGQHAPYEMAVTDLDYWTNIRGIAKEKLSLGLPFYGYGFGTGAPAEISFGRLVDQYPGAENTDQLAVTGGGIIYYNGIPTIKTKTQLALQRAGGIMIWQLMGDGKSDKSLLNVINYTIAHSK
ncbi:MAG: glycosyl hydrolase family 18 protein [Mucilaginibacter sp.]